MGYFLQFLVAEQPPIFIPHKMQYVEFEKIPQLTLVMSLLKGKKCNEKDIQIISYEIVKINERASLGYRFRRDINKLLKMRKKRKGHNRKVYGEDTAMFITEIRFNEDAVYRVEAERIFERIALYIHRVRSIHE